MQVRNCQEWANIKYDITGDYDTHDILSEEKDAKTVLKYDTILYVNIHIHAQHLNLYT